jgi:autotransporter strand-loop-strand O-heptosyltransferase
MKIAQVNLGLLPIPPNGWGATEKIIWEYKIELEKLGHEVDIPYINEIQKDMYDIVHVHVWNHALEMYEKGIPYIFTCHDHHLYLNGNNTKMYQDNLLAMKLSETSFVPAKYLVEYFENIPVYLEHGVRLDNFSLNKSKNTKKILCVGNNGLSDNKLFDRKGFRYAIEAADKLNLPITIVGPTNVNKNFFDTNKDLIKDNVNVLYDLSDDNLIKTFTNHDILVHATSIEAGHPPLTILEAAASGLPVLTTDCSGDLYVNNIKRDVDNIVDTLQYVIENYEEERKNTIDSVKNFDWRYIVSKLNKTYESVVLKDMRSSALNIYNRVKKISHENKIDFNFISGAYCIISGQKPETYNVKFIDKDTDTVIYSADISTNSWARTSRKWYTNWKTVVTDSNNNVFEHELNLKNKKVLIFFDSSCTGDTIAWIPYVEEFRKKHECDLYVFTFHNYLFSEAYPNIKFIDSVDNSFEYYASYKLGWGYELEKGWNLDMNKNPANEKPLQQTITDILGLEYTEIKPKIKKLPKYETKKPYICIATNSTAQAKYWNNRTGWQELVDYVKSFGYDVYLISKEEDGYMGNKQPDGVIKIKDKNLEEIGSILQGSKFFVGLGSGLTWYAWALNVPTILISGFSEPWQEMKSDIIRVINTDVCHGCFAKHLFNRGDWDWCPEHKGTSRQFECTKSITFEMVKPHIEKLLKM